MVYREFQDLQLSALGMGAMRLPVIDGNDAQIDKEATAEMVAYAMEHGINYMIPHGATMTVIPKP